MIKFNGMYCCLAVVLFITEVLIALYMSDAIIRPYGGDFLVVILIYCTLKSFLNIPIYPTAAGVFLFACFIEVLQYLQLVKLLGLQDVPVARVVLGTSFQWIDILMYASGILLVIAIEAGMGRTNFKKTWV